MAGSWIGGDATGLRTEGIFIDTAGKVGFGTATPVKQVQVNDTGTDVSVNLTNSNTGTGATDGMYFGYTNQAWIWNYENTSLSFGTNNDTKVTIEPTGDVGFGITNAAHNIHINDSATESAVLLTNTNTGNTASDGLYLGYTNQAFLWNYEATDLSFATNNLSRMTFDASGEVGIGINTPNELLHMYDATNAISIKQTADGGTLTNDYARVGTTAAMATSLIKTTKAGASHGYLDLVSFGGTGGSQYGHIRFFAAGRLVQFLGPWAWPVAATFAGVGVVGGLTFLFSTIPHQSERVLFLSDPEENKWLIRERVRMRMEDAIQREYNTSLEEVQQIVEDGMNNGAFCRQYPKLAGMSFTRGYIKSIVEGRANHKRNQESIVEQSGNHPTPNPNNSPRVFPR